MIIRVFRGRLRAGSEAEFYRIVREERLPAFRRKYELLEAHVGRRHHPDGDRFTVITIWPDYETLAAWVGSDPRKPYGVDEIEEFLAEWRIEHYEELEEGEPEGLVPAPRPTAEAH